MKTAEEIHSDMISRFENKINDKIQAGSAIDLFATAIAQEYEELYAEIERNRTPHVWTYLEGEYIDKAALGLNLPRKNNESDNTYKYRLSRWGLINEASNTTAIETRLFNMEHASYAEFVPKTRGAGTGTVYVIPRHYNTESIENSLAEAKTKIQDIVSPSLHIEYVIPEVKSVRLQISLRAPNIDLPLLKSNLESEILEYVNNIAPNDYLDLGEINRIGINTAGVKYFNVLGLYINDEIAIGNKILQDLDTKLLFDEIMWIDED